MSTVGRVPAGTGYKDSGEIFHLMHSSSGLHSPHEDGELLASPPVLLQTASLLSRQGSRGTEAIPPSLASFLPSTAGLSNPHGSFLA